MTQSSLTQALKDAVEAVEAASVPTPLQEAAFVRALDYLLADKGRASDGTMGASGADTGGSKAEGKPRDATAGDPVGAIAKRLHIDRGVASRILDVDDEGVHLVVQRSKLEATRSAATQQVARLIVAARQAVGLDAEWTAVEEVRRAAEQKGVLDSGNFARHIGALDGDGMRIRGERNNRAIKMSDTGFEAAGQLALRLAGAE